MCKALKILYFADKEHLARYGRLICGDSYVAMRLGSAPSGAYDLVKTARGEGLCMGHLPIQEAFAADRRTITPRREPDLDLLSQSDIECLDLAIRHCGHMSLGQLNTSATRKRPTRMPTRTISCLSNRSP